MKESAIPTIVCVLKPKTRSIYNALEPAGDEVDLVGWTPITLTSIMRTSKSLCSLGYDLEKSDTNVANLTSVIGIGPVVICINKWDIENLKAGLVKAMELAKKKEKEEKVMILVDNYRLSR